MSWFSTDTRKLNQASATVSPLLGLPVFKMDKVELRACFKSPEGAMDL